MAMTGWQRTSWKIGMDGRMKHGCRYHWPAAISLPPWPHLGFGIPPTVSVQVLNPESVEWGGAWSDLVARSLIEAFHVSQMPMPATDPITQYYLDRQRHHSGSQKS